MLRAEVHALRDEAEEHAARSGGWLTDRHVSYPTTDIEIRSLPRLARLLSAPEEAAPEEAAPPPVHRLQETVLRGPLHRREPVAPPINPVVQHRLPPFLGGYALS